MRKIVFHMQTTLDNRIANGAGALWEPFPWGEAEVDYVNGFFRTADLWVMGRTTYEAIVPYWDGVATGKDPEPVDRKPAEQEFAAIQHGLRKVVISRSLASDSHRQVITGNIADALRGFKAQPGKNIMLSCGVETLRPLVSTTGLIDEYLLPVNPVALSSGPRVFDALDQDLPLRLLSARSFEGGAVVLHYAVQRRP